jgi:DNA-binding transcriptional ArsR family regulator
MASDPFDRQLELAAEILKALAEPHRLKIALRLARGEMSVGQLADADEENITTVSARLKVLLTAKLVKRRRKGQTIFYAVADAHVLNLVDNTIEHACEGPRALFEKEGKEPIVPQVHANHPHKHGPGCGHIAIGHGDHVDFLHDGHLHHQNGGVVEEHKIEVSAANPDKCTPAFGHTGTRRTMFMVRPVDTRPSRTATTSTTSSTAACTTPDGDHCDDHGPVTVI